MKEKIHPAYMECKVTCGCGNTFMTRSTKPELHVEICHMCHPFYSGKQKFVDTAGRVEKFQKKHAWDNATMGKVLEKEPPKKAPKKLEKVSVGLPKLKKRKAGEGEEDGDGGAPRGKGGKGSKEPKEVKGAKAKGAPKEAPRGAAEGAAPAPAETKAGA